MQVAIQNQGQKALQTFSAGSNLMLAVIEAKHSLKIKDMEPTVQHERIKMALKNVMAMIGIAPMNRPDELIFAQIVNFFIEHMNWISPDDIQLAFICAAAGKFEANLSIYNRSFSIEYVTDPLKKYLKWRGELKDTVIQARIKEEKKKPTDEERAEIMFQGFKNAFNEFISTKHFDDYANCIHDYLVGAKWIGEESWKRYLSDAEENVRKRNSQPSTSNIELDRMKKVLKMLAERNCPDLIENEAKQLCLMDFFTKSKEYLENHFKKVEQENDEKQ
jgi:hypothetical protein